MNQKLSKGLTTTFLIFLFAQQPFSTSPALAQRRISRASSFRLEKNPNVPLGNRLYITVAGTERKITNQALDAWLTDGGKSIVYSGLDGSGGFENEGQSLRSYDVRTATARKVLSEYFIIIALKPIKLSNGRLALLVKMGDGGLGASYFAVVDPLRGEVFYRHWAELIDISGDQIKLAVYREDDWEKILGERSGEPDDPNKVTSHTKVKPQKVETHDLKQLLKRRTIRNKRSPM